MTGEVSPGNDEFQQGIRRAVPLGWLFKGFPLHQRHLDVRETVSALLGEPQAMIIIIRRLLITTNDQAS